MIEVVLFDLDGTLLPMDQDEFTREYFRLLAKKLIPYGYEPKKLVDSIWKGTAAMVKNDGSCTNEAAFWREFSSIYGEKVLADMPVFDEFYCREFNDARTICGYNAKAAETVHRLKKLGLRTALATNPIFPSTATENRIRWAGLVPEDFELYTTYENTRYCKPNPLYYTSIAKQLNVKAEHCLMVGNDAIEDVAAQAAGMGIFLLADCLINKAGIDISVYPHGGFTELMAYIGDLL